jgi:hypothetical protein
MLGTSNTLKTSNNNYSKKVKDITMSNQQVAEIYIDFSQIWNSLSLLSNLRDYTWRTLATGLRYSPIYLNNIIFKKLNIINVYKVLKRKLSTNHLENKLDPYWVTGFVDAEGCFSVVIEISEIFKRKVRISFEINLHEKDKDILYNIKSFFGVGAVYIRSTKKLAVYRVTNVNLIKNIIIPHFTKYPLISKKRIDFLLWSKVVEMILNKDHLTEKGFLKILSYYASINRGVSKKVLKYYPNISATDKPVINLPDNLNPQWVSGFVAGDGGFSIYIRPAKINSLSQVVSCRFHIAQHSKDLELMKLFIKFFDCGSVVSRSNIKTPRCDFIVQDITCLYDKILLHFDTYPLLNLKQEDYICFKKCMTIIKLKKHLTIEGLKTLNKLIMEMNNNRYK